jgi:hypothetical protein
MSFSVTNAALLVLRDLLPFVNGESTPGDGALNGIATGSGEVLLF